VQRRLKVLNLNQTRRWARSESGNSLLVPCLFRLREFKKVCSVKAKISRCFSRVTTSIDDENMPFVPTSSPIDEGEFCEAQVQEHAKEHAKFGLIGRHVEKVLSEASNILAQKMNINVHIVRHGLNQIHADYRAERLLTKSENVADAKTRLENVAVQAQALSAALRNLGPGALAIMRRRSTELNVYRESESWTLIEEADQGGLPSWSPFDSLLPNLQAELDEMLPGLEEKIELGDAFLKLKEEKKRGGRWLIRLKALATLAQRKAREIEEGASNRGPLCLGMIINGTPNEWLMGECLRFIRQHGGSDPLARSMALAVIEAETRKEPTRGAGRKALARVSRTPLKRV